jgi:hypothetical protein
MMTAAKRYRMTNTEEVRHSLTATSVTNLGIVLRIASVQRNRLEVKPTVEINGGDDVL